MNTLTTSEVRPESRRGQSVSKPSATSIYRDVPLSRSTTGWTSPRHLTGVLPSADPSIERADGVAMLGLAALIVPAIAYSFAQLTSLVSSGSLLHAIHALLP